MRAARVAAVLLAAAAAAGCSRLEPWVKPYERENIADPIMAWDPDPVASSYMLHVYEARDVLVDESYLEEFERR